MELCKSSDLDPNNVKSDELPEWMTIEFFQDIFKKAHPSTQGHVRNINVSYATKSGDNFASILYRAKLIIGKESEYFNLNKISEVYANISYFRH